MLYENILIKAENDDIIIIEKNFKSNAKGLIKNNRIGISHKISTFKEKVCILAEELGHYYTSFGDILDQGKVENRKQEKRARNWAYEKLVPLDKIIAAYKTGIQSRHELALYLDVTEDFIEKAIKHYYEKYGFLEYKGYLIYFEPLILLKDLERE